MHYSTFYSLGINVGNKYMSVLWSISMVYSFWFDWVVSSFNELGGRNKGVADEEKVEQTPRSFMSFALSHSMYWYLIPTVVSTGNHFSEIIDRQLWRCDLAIRTPEISLFDDTLQRTFEQWAPWVPSSLAGFQLALLHGRWHISEHLSNRDESFRVWNLSTEKRWNMMLFEERSRGVFLV